MPPREEVAMIFLELINIVDNPYALVAFVALLIYLAIKDKNSKK